ncbi:MAG: hypothetical protein N2445_05935, partial [Acidobacteria bacterium]|nr:hypothetical protein [Acidobacteriota bacterium]
MTFKERVKAQEAIEKVYCNHRIWPKENKTPKPPFEQIVSKEVIEKKVEDYLKKSVALEKYWYLPITGKQLQAEMERMAKNTKDPKVLNELFEALNNDPYLIAECLARPVLADRLIRNWYANDERFHKETREKAEEALKHLMPENFCSYPEGEHSKISYKLSLGEREEFDLFDPVNSEIKLSEGEFYRIYTEIPDKGKISLLKEKDNSFEIFYVAEKNETQVEMYVLSFKKKSIENFLKEESVSTKMFINKDELTNFYIPFVENICEEGWRYSSFTEPYLTIPQARLYHSAIWTGTEMIIWGGEFDGSYLNSGGRYNPSTDIW